MRFDFFFVFGKIMSGIFEGLNGNFVLRSVKWVGILLVKLGLISHLCGG